jgi:photosystem II stability/assembly factor-like uncharacterized protein
LTETNQRPRPTNRRPSGARQTTGAEPATIRPGPETGPDHAGTARATSSATSSPTGAQGAGGNRGAHGQQPTRGTGVRPDNRKTPSSVRTGGRASRTPPATTIQVPPRLGAVVLVALVVVLGVGAYMLFTRSGQHAAPLTGQPTPVSRVQGADFHSLAVSPADPDLVWFGSHQGIQESADGGKTWRPVSSASADAMSLARTAADGRKAYMAGHDVFKSSTDGGKTWLDVQTNLPGTDLHGFAVDPATGMHLYSLVVGAGLFESTDGGYTWQPVPTQPPGAYGALAARAGGAGNPSTLYVATQFGVMRSPDGGKTWHRKDSGLPEGERGARALTAVPGKPGEWYAATGDGLYHTADDGTTWEQTTLLGQDLYALAASSGEPLRVYALGSQGEVYRLEGAALGR